MRIDMVFCSKMALPHLLFVFLLLNFGVTMTTGKTHTIGSHKKGM